MNYVVEDGTSFKEKTPENLRRILNNLRLRQTRVRIIYGDIKTGRKWGDEATGRIGRSTGQIKIPLILHNARSLGGESVIDDCILEIHYANKKDGGIIYKK